MSSKLGERRFGGPVAQTSKREHYVRLMNSGCSNSEACRIVGINRRTGTRWRYGRTVKSSNGAVYQYPAVDCAGRTGQVDRDEGISGRYLSTDERATIADGHSAGLTQKQIAEELGRSAATISRELKRNTNPATGRYTPATAQRIADRRRPRPKRRKLDVHETLRDKVRQGLAKRWSPEQICNRLILDYPDDETMRVSPETVYLTIYDQRSDCLERDLHRRLRTGRKYRHKRRNPNARTNRFVQPIVPLSLRPADAENREIAGHWEGDLIVGSHNRSAIGTLVERTSRATILVHIHGRCTADQFKESLQAVYEQLPGWLKLSLTWDQGVEMACHADFTEATSVPVYFCDPHSPWQRGSNENTNGLLRQYFPKHTDLSGYTPNDLIAATDELNNRPRKTLGWKTPNEVLATLQLSTKIATTP